MAERRVSIRNGIHFIETKSETKEVVEITAPMRFIPEYKVGIITYATTEDGQKESWADIRQPFLENPYASMVTGGLRLFAREEFVSILDGIIEQGWPTVDLVFHCADMFENPEEGDYRLKENAKEIFFDRLSEFYENQQRGGEVEHVTQTIQEAMHRRILRLHVAKKRIDGPHSAVLDTNAVFLQRIHREDDPRIPESWLVKNGPDLQRKYEKEHLKIIRSAVPLR